MKRCQHPTHKGARLVPDDAFYTRKDRPDLYRPFCTACDDREYGAEATERPERILQVVKKKTSKKVEGGTDNAGAAKCRCPDGKHDHGSGG